MKIIFLDIDGVLNSHRTLVAFNGFPHGVDGYHRGQFDEVAIGLVRHLCKISDAVIVLSSSWRIIHDYRDIGKALELPIIDQTPSLAECRGAEIAMWLGERNDIETYVILDDDSDMLDGQLPRFVQTSHFNGLSWENAQQAAEILGVDIYNHPEKEPLF